MEEDFARAAVSEAPDYQVRSGLARVYPVYVAKRDGSSVMFFQVHVQRDGGSIISRSGSSGYEFGTYKVAYPADGDPAVEAAILEAVPIAYQFAYSLGDDLAGDAITDIGSAIDLVGPEDSPASYNRRQLMIDINSHYDSYWKGLLSSASDLTSRLVVQILGSESTIALPGVISLDFSDESVVDVRIDQVLEAFDSNGIHLELTGLTHTARLPDGSVIPASAGEFSGFNWSGPSGSNIGVLLARLAALYGLEVGSPGEGGLDCTFECGSDGPSCRLNCS